MEKLYLVENRAFGRGLAVAQAIHATVAFCAEHDAKEMLTAKVVCFGAKDTEEIVRYYERLREADVRVTAFYEPDRNNEMTAFLAEGGNRTAKAIQGLPYL